MERKLDKQARRGKVNVWNLKSDEEWTLTSEL